MTSVITCTIVAIWAVLAISWFRSKRRAGAVLLDLGRSKVQIALGMIFGGVFVLMAIGIVETFIGVYSISVLVMLAVMMLSLAICSLLEGFGRLEIREGGIVFFFTLLKWEQIASYEWRGKRGYRLIFRLRRRWGRKLVWGSIPPVQKEATESLLAQHLEGDR